MCHNNDKIHPYSVLIKYIYLRRHHEKILQLIWFRFSHYEKVCIVGINKISLLVAFRFVWIGTCNFDTFRLRLRPRRSFDAY